MNKPSFFIRLAVLQNSWVFGSLLFVSASGFGVSIKIDSSTASYHATEEQAGSQEESLENVAHQRQRRVIGGQASDWRQYPWLVGLEQIRRDTRDKLLKTDPAYSLSSTTAPAPADSLSSTTTPAPADSISSTTTPAPAHSLSSTTAPAPARSLSSTTASAPAHSLSSTTAPIDSLTVPVSVLPSIPKIKKYQETSGFECSGMLVDRLWVMTAAHCLDSNKGKALKKFVKLTFVNPLTDEVIVRTSRFYLVPVRKPLKNGSRSWPTEVDNGWI